MRFVVCAPFADRLEERVQRCRELLLHFDIAHRASAISFLEILDLGAVRVERVVIHEHRVALDVARIRRAQARRVRVHRAHLFAHHGGWILEIDRVVQRLAHLRLSVGADEPRNAPHEAFGLRKHVLELPIETACDLARELDVRELVLADRHQVRAWHQDVRDLHDRVGEEGDGHRLLAEVVHLRLQRRVALQHPERQEPAEPDGELGVLGDEALDDEAALRGVETDGEPVQRHLPHGVTHARHVVRIVGDLIVGDQKMAVVLVLEPHPVLERAGIVAEVERSGRPDAREDALH